MVDSLVTRVINVDFIYFDLLFLSLWIGFLIRKKYWKPIIWGVLGWFVYLFTDFYIWYIVMGSRTYDGPIDSTLFFLWFCFSPGFAQFSYVALMFEKRKWRDIWLWTLMFYLGWTFVSVVSQLIPINDTLITVTRDMNANKQRLSFGLMTLANVIIAFVLYFLKKIRLEDIVYLFIVGTLVEFCLEFTLTVSGIRILYGGWSFELMVINTLIEFNMGIILMYIIWSFTFNFKKKPIFKKIISWRDFRHIKTDFNLVNSMLIAKTNSDDLKDFYKNRYSKEALEFDLEYLKAKAQTPKTEHPSE
ncbi:MAG: hypothetical protein KGD64_01710 [Candidatus Heimdallarchaeota archaeon]|nr:hypothetical protein [Candidatus Heimdallarchaeota archaeon]